MTMVNMGAAQIDYSSVLMPLGILSGLSVAIHHQFMSLSFTFTGCF